MVNIKKNLSCLVLLIVVYVSVLWIYLHCSHYIITVSDEMRNGYNLAASEGGSFRAIFKDLLPSLWVCRGTPPMIYCLYAAAFLACNFYIYTPIILAVTVGSICIIFFYFSLLHLFGRSIALMSTLFLATCHAFLEQLLVMGSALPGLLFFLPASYLLVHYFTVKRSLLFLFLSGYIMSFMLICRFENIFFLLYFVLFVLCVDTKSPVFSKCLFAGFCLNTAITFAVERRLGCNSDFFSFVTNQLNCARENLEPVSVWTAISIFAQMLHELIVWPYWILYIIGTIALFFKQRKATIIVFCCIQTICLFFITYIRIGGVEIDEKYIIILLPLCIPFVIYGLYVVIEKICVRNVTKTIAVQICVAAFIFFNIYGLLTLHVNGNLRHIAPGFTINDLRDDFRSLDPTIPFFVSQEYGSGALLYYSGHNPYQYVLPYDMQECNNFCKERRAMLLKTFFLFVFHKDWIDKFSLLQGRKCELIRTYANKGLYKIYPAEM